MYGDKGPPKGYSVPRYDTDVKKHCQLCSSTLHWTYECPTKKGSDTPTASAKKSGTATVKLSRSQMLKYGIKAKPANFVPEPTEREVFDAELKDLRAVLTAEVRSELKGGKTTSSTPKSTQMEDPTQPVAVKSEAAANPPRIKKERKKESD